MLLLVRTSTYVDGLWSPGHVGGGGRGTTNPQWAHETEQLLQHRQVAADILEKIFEPEVVAARILQPQ